MVAFGARAENCATYLTRGRAVAIEGRLDWREWEAKDGSGKRQAVQIVANTVQFLGSRDGGEGHDEVKDRFASELAPAPVDAAEEEVPF